MTFNSLWELDGVRTALFFITRKEGIETFNSLWELDGVRTAGLGALERQGTEGGIARISYFRHKLLRLSWKKTSYCAKIKDRGSPGFFAHQRPSHLTFLQPSPENKDHRCKSDNYIPFTKHFRNNAQMLNSLLTMLTLMIKYNAVFPSINILL